MTSRPQPASHKPAHEMLLPGKAADGGGKPRPPPAQAGALASPDLRLPADSRTVHPLPAGPPSAQDGCRQASLVLQLWPPRHQEAAPPPRPGVSPGGWVRSRAEALARQGGQSPVRLRLAPRMTCRRTAAPNGASSRCLQREGLGPAHPQGPSQLSFLEHSSLGKAWAQPQPGSEAATVQTAVPGATEGVAVGESQCLSVCLCAGQISPPTPQQWA